MQASNGWQQDVDLRQPDGRNMQVVRNKKALPVQVIRLSR